MLTENKKLWLVSKIMVSLGAAAMVICFICDFAINKRVVWSGYPLAAIPFACLIAATALLMNKYRLICSLLAFSAAIFPFLYVLERLTPIKGWFTPLGLPSAAIFTAALWITLCMLKFLKVNKWYMASGIFFLYGIVVNLSVNLLVSAYVKQPFLSFGTILNLITAIAVTVLLAILGHYKALNEALQKDRRQQEPIVTHEEINVESDMEVPVETLLETPEDTEYYTEGK